ncbi:MAG: 5'-methylthioadenosine/S-adenosylhomocysteine nucleosidase [Acidimicrobiia bacterium]
MVSGPSASVALLSAIPPEMEELVGALVGGETFDLAGRPVTAGVLDGVEVVVAEAGIGKVNAAIAVTLLVERFGCRIVVVTGVAGGLDPELRVGDVVIAERTVQHDAGILGDSGISPYQPGHLPFFNPTEASGYRVSPVLLSRVRDRLDDLVLPALTEKAGGSGEPPRLRFGTVLSGDQFVNSEGQRKRLFALGGSVVEMEGGAVAQTAETLGIDHLVIRSLSDLAGAESTVDFGLYLSEVAANSVLVVRHLLPVL